MKTKNLFIIIIPILIFLILGIGLIFTNIPIPDESWHTSPAMNLLREGVMRETNFISWGDIGPQIYSPLYYFNEVLVIKIFGFSLFTFRFMCLFWGLLGLIAIIFLLKKIITNNTILFLSLLLVSTDIFFLKSSSYARYDIPSVSLALIAITLYLYLREKKFILAIFLSNLFICLSCLYHFNGLIGFAALIFLIIYLDRKKIKLKVVLVALIPYLIGIILYGIYIFENYSFFINQFNNVINKENVTTLNPLKLIYYEFVYRYLYAYGLSPQQSSIFSLMKIPVIIFYFICLIIFPVFIKEKDKKVFWWILLICFLILTFEPVRKAESYLCWITPFFIISASLIFYKFNAKKVLKIIFIVCFLAIFMISITRTVYSINHNDYQNKYISDLKQFNEKYYNGGKIYGPGEITFYYGYNDNIIQSDYTLGFYTGVLPEYIATNSSFEESFEDYTSNVEIYNHIKNTLDKKFIKIFKGNYYTFYKKIGSQ
jgi:4-amino-4-deoxy-L-arabinose transferase-like glycosyltransferase